MKSLCTFFTLLFAGVAFAQIEVDLSFKRRTYLRGEPIEAKVSIRNLSGAQLQRLALSGDAVRSQRRQYVWTELAVGISRIQ